VSAEHPNDLVAGGQQASSGAPAAEDVGSAAQPPKIRELATIPAVEVITRASVMLMSAAAEKLGLAEDGEHYLDLDEARRLIEAYAGLLGASQAELGAHRQPLRDGLKALQKAFREASPYPDQPGQGRGDKSGF
jgi:hypothetical protein